MPQSAYKFRGILEGAQWALAGILLCLSAANAGYQDEIGLYDLRARDASLTGSRVIVAQIEAQQNGTDNYQTDPVNAGLSSSLFKYYDSSNPWSGGGAAFDSNRESGHANIVGSRFFGVSTGSQVTDGVAPGVESIQVFEAGHYYNDLLRLGTSTNAAIINQSFVFLTQDAAIDTNYDNYADNQNVLFVNGINNNGDIPSPASSYNGIAVNVAGDSASPLTDGRSKPDISAPGSTLTSYVTPLVSGAAAILTQSALEDDAGAGTSAFASDIRTLKALILNGASKPVGWTHTTSRPLDINYGTGILEINQAHLQLIAGQYTPTQDEVLTEAGTAHPPPSGETGIIASYSGWNLGNVSNTADSYGIPANRKQYDVTDHYYFDLNSSEAAAFYLTSTLVWNRQSGQSSINNLELFLYKSDGTLIASSESSVDNVEHLYERHLAPGRYVLQVHKPYNPDSITNGETYALAFNFTAAPAPGSPSSLSANTISTSEIDLNWSDTSDDETGYRVERRPSGGTYNIIATLAADSTAYLDSGLASGTTYEYRITAFNAEAESSATASATTESSVPAPTAPSDPSASAASTSAIDLSWTDTSDDENGFLIERRLSGGSYLNIVNLAANSSSYSDSGLTDGTLYEYRITAYNDSGSSDATTTSEATWVAAPSGTSSSTISLSELLISWNDHSASEDGYRIERRLSGGTYSILTTVTANTTSYSNSGLSDSTTYDYRITAYNSTGDSSSAETSGTTYSKIENWRLDYFGTTSNSGDAADDYDYDFDSLANLLEYLTGSDPTTFSASPMNTSLLGSDGQISFNWRIDSGYDFSIGYSVDLTLGFTDYTSATLDGDSSPVLEHIGTNGPVDGFETRHYGVRESVTSHSVFLRLLVD